MLNFLFKSSIYCIVFSKLVIHPEQSAELLRSRRGHHGAHVTTWEEENNTIQTHCFLLFFLHEKAINTAALT